MSSQAKVGRAPRIPEHPGLEWAFRIAQEPRRRGHRYAVTNVGFICAMLREATAVRVFRMRRPEVGT